MTILKCKQRKNKVRLWTLFLIFIVQIMYLNGKDSYLLTLPFNSASVGFNVDNYLLIQNQGNYYLFDKGMTLNNNEIQFTKYKISENSHFVSSGKEKYKFSFDSTFFEPKKISNVVDCDRNGLIIQSDKFLVLFNPNTKKIFKINNFEIDVNILDCIYKKNDLLIIIKEFSTSNKLSHDIFIEVLNLKNLKIVYKTKFQDLHGIRRFIRTSGEIFFTNSIYDEKHSFLISRSQNRFYRVKLKNKNQFFFPKKHFSKIEIDTIILDKIKWNQLNYFESDSLLNKNYYISIADIKLFSKLVREHSSILSVLQVSKNSFMIKIRCENDSFHNGIFFLDKSFNIIQKYTEILPESYYLKNLKGGIDSLDYVNLTNFNSNPVLINDNYYWANNFKFKEDSIEIKYVLIK